MSTTKKQMEKRRKTLRPHPTRSQIVDVMRSYGQPISPTQLSRITGGSLGSTAYHVRTLVSAGIVELVKQGRVRGAVEHFYVLVSGNEDELRLADPVGQLLGLCDALNVPGHDGDYPRKTVLDARARKELLRLIAKVRPEVRDIAAAATSRSGS